MLDSYFFVPGDKPNYLSKIDTLSADYVVIDLEDSVPLNNKQSAFELVRVLPFKKNMFLRIPFFDYCYTEQQLKLLVSKFEGQIVLPKIHSFEDVHQVVSLIEGTILKMIVLIENPSSFIETRTILKKYATQIHAIGFGSHDFCSITGIKHTLENLAHYKRELILYANAFNVPFLDGVDLNLIDMDQFRNECVFAFESGAEGKFLIHPKQLDELRKIVFLTSDEIDQLSKVYAFVKDIPLNEIKVYNIDGRVYERPHIARIKCLMEKIIKRNSSS